MTELDYQTMFDARMHVGHKLKRRNPKFDPYLYRYLYGIAIIDLEKTHACLEKAAQFLSERIKEGAQILFVGTKPQAQEVIRTFGQTTHMPFCANRWLGGCLTNFQTIQTSLAKYKRFLDMEKSGELDQLPKKESAVIQRSMARMHRGFEGILDLEKLPDILFVIDAKKEMIALREARRLGIPTVGIVDSDSDPTWLDYPIPANDDFQESLKLLMDYLSDVVTAAAEAYELSKVKEIPDETVLASKAKAWMNKRTLARRRPEDANDREKKIAPRAPRRAPSKGSSLQSKKAAAHAQESSDTQAPSKSLPIEPTAPSEKSQDAPNEQRNDHD